MSNPAISLVNVTLPVGAIIPFAGNVGKYQAGNSSSPPSSTTQPIESYGWMLCDGSPLNSYEYPELFAALGYLYGGSGSTFNLPNLAGQFLRGIGTDSASTENRIAAPGGHQNGVGSKQSDALQTHQHTYNEPTGVMPGDKGSAFAATAPAYTSAPVNQSPPAAKVSQYETRPTNVFVNYLIKYTYNLPAFQHPL